MDSGSLEAVPNGTVHLDTVRALHQTVVSLRTALEVSKNSLKELKEKYDRHSHCLEYAGVIEKLTIENHILRRRFIDLGLEERDSVAQSIKLEVTYSPRFNYPASDVVIETATEPHSKHSASEIDSATALSVSPTLIAPVSEDTSKFCSTKHLNKLLEVAEKISESPESNATADTADVGPDDRHNNEADEISQIISNSDKNQQSFKSKLQLLSKFDVRIKVRTLKEGTVVSSSTSDSDSSGEKGERKDSNASYQSFQFEEKHEHFDSKEDLKGNQINLKTVSTEKVKMAVPNEPDAKCKTDKLDVQVLITSEENLVVKETLQRSRRKDTLNLDVDDLSLRSLSEGDNSVFSEGGTTPVEPVADEKQQEGSGNESEEVDDIELIFTTHESKDMSMNLQEDLVSIREMDTSETWTPNSASSTHSTPVLITFHTLDPDFQPPPETSRIPDSLRKRVSLPSDKEIRHVAFNKDKDCLDLPGRGILKTCENKSDNMLYRKGPNRLNSVDSLTGEYNRGLSFDNTKSCSFEMGSSMDILTDQHLGHRFSVFAERDISKCGTSEDDLALSLNVRRNTCPNPFLYRVPPYRPPGPLKAPLPPSRLRPVLRESAHPRRENAAQTDLSALPNRWSSEGYLAHNQMSSVSSVAPPTLPHRTAPRRAARPPPPTPACRTDETRRLLLSDIGFTSMVPELSRSADPVWIAKKQLSDETITNSTSKYMSRGSSLRSPLRSPLAGSDWSPHLVHVPPTRNAARRTWRSSLPDVRRDDTEELLNEAETFVRRSIENLHTAETDADSALVRSGQPYIPAGPEYLRLGHTVKVITPRGRIAVGRVRSVDCALAPARGATRHSHPNCAASPLHTKRSLILIWR